MGIFRTATLTLEARANALDAECDEINEYVNDLRRCDVTARLGTRRFIKDRRPDPSVSYSSRRTAARFRIKRFTEERDKLLLTLGELLEKTADLTPTELEHALRARQVVAGALTPNEVRT